MKLRDIESLTKQCLEVFSLSWIMKLHHKRAIQEILNSKKMMKLVPVYGDGMLYVELIVCNSFKHSISIKCEKKYTKGG